MTMIVTIPIKTGKDIATPGPTVLVLGYFDGVHVGHQKLFDIAGEIASRKHFECCRNHLLMSHLN